MTHAAGMTPPIRVQRPAVCSRWVTTTDADIKCEILKKKPPPLRKFLKIVAHLVEIVCATFFVKNHCLWPLQMTFEGKNTNNFQLAKISHRIRI